MTNPKWPVDRDVDQLTDEVCSMGSARSGGEVCKGGTRH